MLVLSRKSRQRILVQVGEIEVWITVIDIDVGKVQIGIDAPKECKINREELLPWQDKEKPC